MIDVFFRTFDIDNYTYEVALRTGLATACAARWKLQKDAHLRLISTPFCKVPVLSGRETIPVENFHIASKRYAEEHATTPIYVIADDDCMPLGRHFIQEGLYHLTQNPQYGLLAAASVIEHASDNWAGIDVAESQAGGIAFVRKGILTEFNDCAPDQVDDTICQEFKRKGYKTGLMPHVWYNHLGYGYSVTSRNPDNWRA